MFRVAVLVSGGGTNLQAIIDRVKDGSLPGVGIVRVISNNAGAYALTRAKNAGIEGVTVSPKEYETRELFNKALLRAVKEASPDLIVLAGFLVTIPPELIREYPDRIINIHPSLIPSFCGKGCYGLHVHEKALARGVKVTGATVHFVNEGLDSGPIILQKPVAVEDGDTPEILQKRVMEQAEWIILPRAIGLIAEGRVSVENGITHIAPKKQG
ncbi:MAG: phosphoribosylglycinamide formyltransferase [Lachnospiraceae bacterium]|jgi:phosphoribosylglycinamide formyltransferase-1|nr:phosphoribosylglycinamide formyltransferase [Lachnospiraceae bacterium]MCH4028007.1 phosphoribosylglycinamide formyltransferase [Lachnospiraceae bacterium]MCH4065851.1 phosphoribosylglycinamide formyltransferase [Lachnospiraceae bacterium]MCH4111887.1 phosphoribosylglycinamide formyltransferase [Lachnospiraceae bacterium]MCI1352314.1 phosphoribosylglycinamide formyltransferase [Lachnospiraceae bacterium]